MNLDGWKKVESCGWTKCPLYQILSNVAQDMAHSWFWSCAAKKSQSLGHFGAPFLSFL